MEWLTAVRFAAGRLVLLVLLRTALFAARSSCMERVDGANRLLQASSARVLQVHYLCLYASKFEAGLLQLRFTISAVRATYNRNSRSEMFL